MPLAASKLDEPSASVPGSSDLTSTAPAFNWIADNSQLRATTAGLGYRRSRHLDDEVPDKTLEWGETVPGWLTLDGWLKVGPGFFLPTNLDGAVVLKRDNRARGRSGHGGRAPPGLPEDWIADNSRLGAAIAGLGYRRSKRLDDMDPDDMLLEWGDAVSGSLTADGWLKVGPDLFLPVTLANVPVLKKATAEAAAESRAVTARAMEKALEATIPNIEIRDGVTWYNIRLSGKSPGDLGVTTFQMRYNDFKLFDKALRVERPTLDEVLARLPESGLMGFRHKLGFREFEQKRWNGLRAYLNSVAAYLREEFVRALSTHVPRLSYLV